MEGLRTRYSLIKFIESTPCEPKDALKELLIGLKRELRQDNGDEGDALSRNHLVKDYGIDGCVYKLFLPEQLETKEEATDWFYDNEFIYYHPSLFDCTGRLFTDWFKVGKDSQGRFFAYHRIGRDC